MTQIDVTTNATQAPSTTGRPRWPLYASAAGVFGFVATLVLDGRTSGDNSAISEKLFTDLSPLPYRLSMLFGYAAVVALLLLAASWRRHVEPRLAGSTAAHLVPLGLLASAAGLTYGYGWKGALGLYMPGGLEEGSFDTQGLYVYYMLNDFGSFIGWLGVVVAAGAVAWMALRERTVSRWVGIVSVIPVFQTTLMLIGLGVPGVQGLLAPIWLLVLGLGLTFGRHTITR